METPSSMSRITRSQSSAACQKSKQEGSNSRSRSAAALLDITNDSPIVGLATGGLVEKTPWVRGKQTPGSGEALLRGQVKTLLQKVEEEEAVLVNNKLSFGPRPPIPEVLGLPVSPALLLAPTPANTPQILCLSDLKEDILMGEKVPSEEQLDRRDCYINRALLFDSPGKSEMSDGSTSYQDSRNSGYRERSSEDDNSSAWSLQLKTSIQEDDEEEVVVDYEAEEEEEEEGEDRYDNLCDDLMRMTVQEQVNLPEFTGKHTRFIYSSDGEIEGEEEVSPEKKAVSTGALLLKGLPAPEGKHLRFQEDEEEEE